MKIFSILLGMQFILITTFAQNTPATSFDTLKQNVKALGNMFKKPATVNLVFKNIETSNSHFVSLKDQVSKTLNVVKTEQRQEQNMASIVVLYKGKATDLWNALPLNHKQFFTIAAVNDSIMVFNYQLAKNNIEFKPSGSSASSITTDAANLKEAIQLTPQASLLFNNVKTALSKTDQNNIAKDLILSKDRKAFVMDTEEGMNHPYQIIVYPTDLNKDGKEEIFLLYGNTYTSGGTGSSVTALIKDKNGSYQNNLNFPGAGIYVLPTASQGYPDLLIGGMGFEFPIWRWNGKEYNFYKKINEAAYQKINSASIEDVSKTYTENLPRLN